jgi:hypothetical protein
VRTAATSPCYKIELINSYCCWSGVVKHVASRKAALTNSHLIMHAGIARFVMEVVREIEDCVVPCKIRNHVFNALLSASLIHGDVEQKRTRSVRS